jgi:hypothetical protein
LKSKRNVRVAKRTCRLRSDFDRSRQLLEVGDAFVRYRDQKRSSIRLNWCRAIERQLDAHILIESNPKLSQAKESVGQNGNAEQAENESCG